jgi:poly-gamma-glutamate synthesis protein (capsule biosynthesis protein)
MTFRGESSAIPAETRERMRRFSWRATLPGGFIGPHFDELRLLRVTHWDFEGRLKQGELVVASSVAEDVLNVFRAIHQAQFPIAQLRLIDDYAGSDEASMADNNSSGYNCRPIAGTTRPSKHAAGLAIDINPLQNPYVIGGVVYPEAASSYVERQSERPGMLFDDGPVVRAFIQVGWRWGGHWQEPQDYHHFEAAQ